MSIKKRVGKFDVSITRTIDGETHRFDKTFDTLKEAKANERAFLYNLDIGNTPTKDISFLIYGQSYIDSLDGLSPRTKESYQQKFNYLKNYFKGSVGSYKNTKIKIILAKIKKDHNLSNRSMNHIFNIMKRIFR